MRVIYMPNSGKIIEEPKPKPIPPALLAGGAGVTAVTGFTAYRTWDTLMTYKWVLLLGIILIALIIIFAWRSFKGSKEEEPEEE
jgi:hypothetical protein